MLEPEPELVALVAVAGARDAEVALPARRLLAFAPRGGVHPVTALRPRLPLALIQSSCPASTSTKKKKTMLNDRQAERLSPRADAPPFGPTVKGAPSLLNNSKGCVSEDKGYLALTGKTTSSWPGPFSAAMLRSALPR